MSNVALLQRVQGDVGHAREINRLALSGFDSKLGRDHHYSLSCAINLASGLRHAGRRRRRAELGEETLARLEGLLGLEHPLTLACAANLIIDLEATGEVPPPLKERTFEIYDRVLGDGHPDVIVAKSGHRLDFDFDPPPDLGVPPAPDRRVFAGAGGGVFLGLLGESHLRRSASVCSIASAQTRPASGQPP